MDFSLPLLCVCLCYCFLSLGNGRPGNKHGVQSVLQSQLAKSDCITVALGRSKKFPSYCFWKQHNNNPSRRSRWADNSRTFYMLAFRGLERFYLQLWWQRGLWHKDVCQSERFKYTCTSQKRWNDLRLHMQIYGNKPCMWDSLGCTIKTPVLVNRNLMWCKLETFLKKYCKNTNLPHRNSYFMCKMSRTLMSIYLVCTRF